MGPRLAVLDGLRGVLAVYVLVSHMAAFAGLPAWVARPLSHGGAAVDVFFILSGMVIVRSMQRFGRDRRGFLIARAARTMPIFLAVFALAVPIQPLPTALAAMPWVGPGSPGRAVWSTGWPHHWAAEIGAHLVMAHGLLPHGVLPGAWVSFLGAAWSLSTEWQFYVLIALLAPVLGAAGPRRLATGLLLLALAAIAWRDVAPAAWQFSRAFLPNKAAYFALGIASAEAMERGTKGRFAAVLAATLLICLSGGQPGKLAAPLVWTLCLAAQAGGERSILAPLARCLRSRPLLALGRASYSIYLVNEPVQKVLALLLVPLAAGDSARFAILWLPLAAALPLGAGFLLHRWVEAPCQRLGRSWFRPAGTSSRADAGPQVAPSPHSA